MAGLGNIVQKAFYLGVGLAATVGEEAGDKLAKLRVQSQTLADELVAKGEMNVEDAKKLVEDLMQQAQQETVQPAKTETKTSTSEPRRIEILSDDEALTKNTTEANNVDALRQQVQAMQDELRRLKRE